jgi:hypothetical protein
VVYGVVPLSHVFGVLALLALIPVARASDLLVMAWSGAVVVLGVGLGESQVVSRLRKLHDP